MAQKVIVIGGGASGLLAAGRAAQRGNTVLLFEKMGQTARKIGISGKGRCNITNSAGISSFIEHFGRNGKFLRQCFQNFFSTDIISLFESYNVPISLERGGRYFPKSSKAMDVVYALKKWVKSEGVQIYANCSVDTILCKKNTVVGIIANKKEYLCDKVIIATGGKSYPRTGSTGDGYTLLCSLGHTITALRPALVPLTTSYPHIKALEGLTFRNTQIRLFVDGKKKRQEFGEIDFIDGKISGAIPRTLSGGIVDLLKKRKTIEFRLDLKPALDDKKLISRLQRDFEQRSGEPISSLLRGILPAQAIIPCLNDCSISSTMNTYSIKAKDRQAIAWWIKNLSMPITGYGNWHEAIVTAGGVSLKEVDPQTMQSRKINGLYIVGELLDLHADTGGYNLQAAFSTGWLAGNSV